MREREESYPNLTVRKRPAADNYQKAQEEEEEEEAGDEEEEEEEEDSGRAPRETKGIPSPILQVLVLILILVHHSALSPPALGPQPSALTSQLSAPSPQP